MEFYLANGLAVEQKPHVAEYIAEQFELHGDKNIPIGWLGNIFLDTVFDDEELDEDDM